MGRKKLRKHQKVPNESSQSSSDEDDENNVTGTRINKTEQLNLKENAKKSVKNITPKGLRNMGNTCFFNAIMQNLTRCQTLIQIIDEYCVKGATINLPENNGKNVTESANGLKTLNLTLNKSGPLTTALQDFFRSMCSATSNKLCEVNPGPVLIQICKIASRYCGTKQEDSHELLRHLIEGIRSEEIRRQKIAILKAFNFHGKVDPKSVDNDMKQKLKAYERLANHTIIDWIFSGQLISTVRCQDCDSASQIFEPFLDLSLPVSEEKPLRPSLHRKISTEDETVETNVEKKEKLSRYQEKKAKRLAKKEAKRNKGKKGKTNTKSKSMDVPDETKDKPNSGSETSEPSDADVEDNAESERSSTLETVVPDLAASDIPSPIDEVCTSLLEVAIAECEEQMEEDKVEDGVTEEEEEVRRNRQRTISERDRLKKEWVERSLTTLAPRYHPESHECSILSCLNQFTAPELLTGKNKFGCENCTKIRQEKLGVGKKCDVVYSNASKQLLIFSPPAVLTLHLKRFQQVGQNLRKVNRHVEFPLILDLAPFCSSMCEVLPNMSKKQSQVLYSLFGIVEHSGRLASGHYAAFVKVKPKDVLSYKFLNLKASSQYNVSHLVDEMVMDWESSSDSKTNKEDNVKSDGKWFYISDSSVSEVNEKNVLRSQAYILFYERIL